VFALPFGRQKLDNGVCAWEKEGTVTPDASRGVGLRDFRGISFAWLVRGSATSSAWNCTPYGEASKNSDSRRNHDRAWPGIDRNRYVRMCVGSRTDKHWRSEECKG
jgi:hypothetical protein